MVLLAATLLLPSCECAPARSKHWRHAPEVQVEPRKDLGLQTSSDKRARRLAIQKRRDHTLRIHVGQDPRHLNPLVEPTIWTRRITMDTVFETLVRYEPPEGGAGSGPGRYVPSIARSWRLGTGSVLVELHPEARFQNGKKITSVDVQFSLDSARDPKIRAPHLRRLLNDVSKVVLATDRAVRIYFSKRNGYILRALAEVPIMPYSVYKGRIGAKKGPVVGSGPYKLASRAEGVVHLTRDPKYWGSKPASIPDIEFVYEKDAAQALTAAKRGELDIIPELIPSHYPEQASAPGLVQSFNPLRLRPNTFHYLVFDTTKPPFDDRRVRHAIALLIDRAEISAKVFKGLARPIAGPIWPGGPGDGPAPQPPPFDPARAGELLDQAGWRDVDKDGYRERAGQRLRVAILAADKTNPVRQRMITSLKRSGISVDLRIGPSGFLLKRLQEGKFDFALLEWRGMVDEDLWTLLHTKGHRNFGKYSSAKVDTVLAQLRAADEPSSRAGLLGKLAGYLATDWPIAPVIAPHPYGLLHRRVQGSVVWDGWISLRSLNLASESSTE